MAVVVKRIVGLPFRVGGEAHSGWLPRGATEPPPTPVRDLLLDLEIQREDSGSYFLVYCSTDGSFQGDTWHQTLRDAEEAAADNFGVEPSQWQAA